MRGPEVANRPVFLLEESALVREKLVIFEWHPGFSVAQKQRSIRSLHEAAARDSSQPRRFLEVSTKGDTALGTQLSAFRLQKTIPGGFRTCLEAAFQGSKVFKEGSGDGRQLSDLYWNRNGKDVKRIMRPWHEVALKQFRFGDEVWPLEPKSAFYDWLYIRALCEHEHSNEIRRELDQYDAFTDIEFNPARSFNCQARSCALFTALDRRSALGRTETRDGFLELLAEHDYGQAAGSLLAI